MSNGGEHNPIKRKDKKESWLDPIKNTIGDGINNLVNTGSNIIKNNTKAKQENNLVNNNLYKNTPVSNNITPSIKEQKITKSINYENNNTGFNNNLNNNNKVSNSGLNNIYSEEKLKTGNQNTIFRSIESKKQNTSNYVYPTYSKPNHNQKQTENNTKKSNNPFSFGFNNIKETNNTEKKESDNIGVYKNGKKFEMNEDDKIKRDYMDIIKRKRQKEGYPKEVKTNSIITKFIMPDYRGGVVEMTPEENANMPSGMSPKEKEYLEVLTNPKKHSNISNFELYWNKVKDEKTYIPDEIKKISKEEFNNLSDNEKIQVAKLFYQHQKNLKIDEVERKKNIADIQKSIEESQKEQNKNTLHTFAVQNAKTEENKIPLMASGKNEEKQKVEIKEFNTGKEKEKKDLIINGTSFENNIGEFFNQISNKIFYPKEFNFATLFDEKDRKSKDVIGEMSEESKNYRDKYTGLEKIREETKKEQIEKGEQNSNAKWEAIFNHRKKEYHKENGLPNGNELKIYYNGNYIDENGKEWKDKPYNITGINTTEEVYKEYIDFIKPSKEKEKEYQKIFREVTTGFLLAGDTFSTEMLTRFLQGDGTKAIYGPNNENVQKVKNHENYKKWTDGLKNEIKNIKNGEELNLKLKNYVNKNGLDFYNNTFGNNFDDMKNAIGSVNIEIKGEINKEGYLILYVKLHDVYDFHFTDYSGERKKGGNGFLKDTKDKVFRYVNDAGVYYQQNGIAKPFEWEMYFTDKIKIK